MRSSTTTTVLVRLLTPCHATAARAHPRRAVALPIALFIFAIRLVAAEPVRKHFDIAAGPAEQALRVYAAQSGRELLFSTETARAVRTNAVWGEFAVDDAIARLLAGTDLRVVGDGKGSVLRIVRAGEETAVEKKVQGRSRAESPAYSATPASHTKSASAASEPPMKSKTPLALLSSWLVLLASPAADAQAPAPEETVTLSPFTVSSSRDTGYTATNSLAGGRLASPIQEMASSISVLTREFLDDIAATDLLTSSQYFANSVPGNPASMNDYAVSLRGFPAGFLYRNFFISYVNPDSYVTERLDAARGPNALVFGDTKAGGTVNMATKQAKFRNFAQLSYRYNSEGGFGRTTADANYKLSDQLAVRAGALYQDENDWRDFTYIRRKGGYATTTWAPFQKTTVRVEGERYVQRQSSPWLGSVLRDSLSAWDGSTTYTAANQPIVAGSGTSRIGANFKVYMPGTGLGVVDWTGFGQTAGNGYQLDTYRPAYVSDRTPIVPNRGYNIRIGDGNDVKLDYATTAAFIEQQVGDNLFLEVAGNFARQERTQFQLATEGMLVDVNRNLPGGAANPNFGKRYTETGAFSFTKQRNTLYEVRATAAYVTKLGNWSQHRLLVGAMFRRDAYRDTSIQTMLDVPGARFGNPNQNANSIRLRVYEDQRGIDQSLPGGIKQGVWNFFPGEDKDLGSGQLAASSKWFADGRLVTLIGVRRDKLRKKATVARIDPVTGSFYNYLERYTGPAAPDLSGAGSLNDFDPVTTRNAGAVYKLTSWLSPYVSYSEGYDTATAGFLLDPATGIANVPLPAKESQGKEFGAKFTLLQNRLPGAIAYYENTQTNDSGTGVAVPRNQINAIWNVVDNVATSPRQLPTAPSEIIDYRGTGIEFEITANLTKNWRAMFNVSFPKTERQGGFGRTLDYIARNRTEWQRSLDALTAANDARATAFRTNLQQIDSAVASVANGLPLTGTLKETINLYSNYEFSTGGLKGLRLGGGANLRGERYVGYQSRIATDPKSFQRLTTKGTATFSLSAGYRMKLFQRAVNFQLNVENLFDEQFKRYTAFNTIATSTGEVVFNGNTYGLQPPRRFILSTDVKF